MSDTNLPKPPWWLRIVNSQRFNVALLGLLKASGLLALPWIHKWFPDVTYESLSATIITALPLAIGVGIDWYRNNPNNILARARKVINGGTASPTAVAATAVTASAAAPADTVVVKEPATAVIVEKKP